MMETIQDFIMWFNPAYMQMFGWIFFVIPTLCIIAFPFVMLGIHMIYRSYRAIIGKPLEPAWRQMERAYKAHTDPRFDWEAHKNQYTKTNAKE